MYKTKILVIIVNIIIVIFEVLFTNSNAFLLFNLILKTDFNNLPPSNGYIGIKLNNAIIKFV